jgi:tRNA A37 methylthiotransferase MiaB
MKIGFLSLGCPKNLVDGEVMLGIARDAGHEITQDSTAADVLVVNTCAFIDNAKEESINAILEMAALKGQGTGKRLVVTGCLAERYRDDLRREIPRSMQSWARGRYRKFLTRSKIAVRGPQSAVRKTTERGGRHCLSTPKPLVQSGPRTADRGPRNLRRSRPTTSTTPTHLGS